MSSDGSRVLEGRHALVCGASAGIGRAAALALARSGASVTGLARSREKLETLTGELRDAGAREARALVVDMEERAALAGAVDRLLAEAGPVHVLVNNTGGPPPDRSSRRARRSSSRRSGGTSSRRTSWSGASFRGCARRASAGSST